MKRSLTKAGLRLNELKLAGAIQLITSSAPTQFPRWANISIKLPPTQLPPSSEGKFCGRCPCSPA